MQSAAVPPLSAQALQALLRMQRGVETAIDREDPAFGELAELRMIETTPPSRAGLLTMRGRFIRLPETA
jgi:hypothetical protein